MRPLTQEEKVRITDIRKQANRVLSERRKAIGASLRSLSITDHRREKLLREFESIRDIKGLPVRLKIDIYEIVVNYELVRRYTRKLKRRHINMTIHEQLSGQRALLISHHERLKGGNRGAAEFYELPAYQRDLLDNLPLVDLTEELIL